MDMANDGYQKEDEDSIITDTDKIIQLRKIENDSPDYENDDNIDRNPTPQFKQTRFNIPNISLDEDSEEQSIRPDYISSEGEDEYRWNRNQSQNYQNRVQTLSRNINK